MTITHAQPPTVEERARQYAQELADLDPWTPMATVIQAAYRAGFLAAACAPARKPTVEPPPLSWQNTRIDHESVGVVDPPLEEPALLPLVHRNGERPCHKPAMYVTRLLRYGEPPDLSLLRLLPDLREPTPVDEPRCGSCGQVIDAYSQRDLDWRPVFDQRLPPMPRTPPGQSKPPAPESSSLPTAAIPAVRLAADAAAVGTTGLGSDESYPSPESPEPVTSPDRREQTLTDLYAQGQAIQQAWS